jgi:hypothetical protein
MIRSTLRSRGVQLAWNEFKSAILSLLNVRDFN